MKKAKVALVSMLMLAGSGMYAQTNGIGGTVTDNTGEPIIGASVKVKGSSNMGTVTDIDGNFKLNVKPGETLIISYIGCKDQEVKAGERFGCVKFGSRVDVYLPKQVKLKVKVGQTMIGGETVIGTVNSK